MKRSLKIFILVFLVMAALVAAGLMVFTSLASRSPEKVTAAVQHQLRRHLDMPVTISQARFEWKRGPRVILSGVGIDAPGIITLRISSVTAYLSIWRLMFGEVTVNKVRLIKPSGTVDLDNLKTLKLGSETGRRPAVLIWKGTVKLIYQGMDLPLMDLNGRITQDWANLRARILGGRVLLETDLGKLGKTTFNAHGIQLEQMDPRFRGTSHISFTLEDVRDGVAGSVSLQAKNVQLPWYRGTLDRVIATAVLSGDRRRMNISEITVQTPLVKASGKGVISGFDDLGSWEDAVLAVEGSTSEFDYERVVAMLPVDLFPDWLRILLTQQIRGGRSQFVSARYAGPLKGFFSGVELLDNLSVVQELRGQSFSAGHTPERITGITGQVVYAKGDIRFRNLSGLAGASRLDRVDIAFPGAVRPLMRVAVDVQADMPAADFMHAWRAAMAPVDVYALLRPVSAVSSGTVRARVQTYYDEAVRNPFAAKGEVSIGRCSFGWAGHTVKGMAATVRAEGFSSPFRIVSSCMYDEVRIRRLDATFTAPFGESRSQFVLLAENLPPVGKINAGNAGLKVTGKGKGLDLSGTFELAAPEIVYSREGDALVARSLDARGDFIASLKEQIHVGLSRMVIRNATSALEGSVDMKGDSGTMEFTGMIDLQDVSVRDAKGTRPLGGTVKGSLSYAFGAEKNASGNISLQDAVLPVQGDLVTINGVLVVRSHKISMNALKVKAGEVMSTISGDLDVKAQPSFKGMVTMEGLKIGGTRREPGGLRDLSADVRLHLVNCQAYGVSVEKAKADATLNSGVLRLENIEMETISGKASGAASFSVEGASDFDMVVSLRGSDLRKLLKATNGSSAIDGTLDLEGHLWGSSDSMNGTFVMNARDGEIRRYALLSQIFSLLNVYRIAQNRDTEFLSNHFSYNSMNATLNIRDNVVSFDDFSLDSNSIQVSAVGTYSLKTKKIDAVLGVQPLETLDRTVSMIPVVGWVLTGEKGKFIVVSMDVHGTMDEPTVGLAPLDTLSNTVEASLLRSLKLPERLLDDSLRLFNGKKQ